MEFGSFARRKPAPPRPLTDIIADETPAWYYRANGFIAQQPHVDMPMDFPHGGGFGFPHGGIVPTRRAPFPTGWLSLTDGGADGGDSGATGADSRPVFRPPSRRPARARRHPWRAVAGRGCRPGGER